MPATFLPRHLSLFLPSLSSASMKLGTSLRASRAIPAFFRIFPFKLKYRELLGRANQVRMLSSQPYRERNWSGPGGGRDVAAVGDGGRGTRRSLIDDEAELSDWVSDLRTSSFKGKWASEDEGSDRDRGSGRGRSKFSEPKRRREMDSGDFGGSERQRTRRTPGKMYGREFSRASRELDSEGDEGFPPPRKSWGDKPMRGSMNPKAGFRAGGRDLGQRTSKPFGRDRGPVSRFQADESEDDYEKERKDLTDLISEDESEDDDSDEDELLERSNGSLSGVEKKVAQVSSGKSDSYLSETRFDQCAISPLSLKGIRDAGYEKMTVVQAATLPVILKGKDVLAKARTGTGKTVAFLLPSIEVVLKSPAPERDQKRPPIPVLIICPTRELASQAAAEGSTLLKYHPSIGVQVVIGGTRLALEQKRLQANPCQILVATPGRLKDHIENTAGFAARLMGVKVLVLDEADQLLDMGFQKDIERIIAAIPKQRQTLLFSATVPEKVRQICHVALKRDHEFINTVEEGSEETHTQVRQMQLVAPLDKQFSILYSILKDHIADDVNYKVLIFCTTAMVTAFVADLLGELHLNVREIHSRKSQSYRTKVSDEFRKSKGLILVTSDVSARGVDYPDVTLVIQMGLPSGREQYIHRLGRTGRKGKEGQGILMLAPWEEFFLSTVKDLPITEASMPSVDPDTKKKVEKALSHVEMKSKESAYQAWLGYYNSNKKIGSDKCKLVELANEFSRCMGLNTPPAIPKLVLGKMGLRNVPGLRSR
ncbi:hypothetical protein SAY86_007188 [Trapa natans]|uniref:ATP-dependent RNA helicase n=1 Tax=Trapa natans TaxID=22666 RepID=A0AAN7LE43_TRANT|nr:hypothetical protein SAY86_007188 [Trapa natans]